MSWMKTSTVLLVLILAVIMITAGCTQTPTTTPNTTVATTVVTPLPTTVIVTMASPTGGNATGMANPASVYCVQVGGNLTIQKDAQGNENGVCNFPNGTSYDEWALFRGEINGTATNTSAKLPVINKTANATKNATANLTAVKTAVNGTNSTAK
jgi:uncharacterized protein